MIFQQNMLSKKPQKLLQKDIIEQKKLKSLKIRMIMIEKESLTKKASLSIFSIVSFENYKVELSFWLNFLYIRIERAKDVSVKSLGSSVLDFKKI
mmetsp:Transcript_11284/g.12920  ORF Transcript_11284/g.12920 Transcript_11284/m.12920 type:complete len:95 (-) Transcript_11284:87-371(-)